MRLLRVALSLSIALVWPTSVFAAAAKIEVVRPGLRSAAAPGVGLIAPVQAGLTLSPIALNASGPSSLVAAAASPALQISAAAVASDAVPATAAAEAKPTAYQTLAAANEPSFSPAVFDGAASLPAPDLDLLDTRRALAQAPVRSLLSPYVPAQFGAVLDGWAQKRHERRVLSQHMPTEEVEMGQSLEQAHAHITAGRPQRALDILTRDFSGRRAHSWFQANGLFAGYQRQGLAYYKHVEDQLLAAHKRVQQRGWNKALIAEAVSAEGEGRLLGHPYRRTQLQDRGSGHCVLHAFHNAISAATGFALPVPVSDFIAYARQSLNKKVAHNLDPRRAAALQRDLGVQLAFDAGDGMANDAMRRFAQILGLPMAERGPPNEETDVLEALRSGRELLLSLRLFHPKYGHAELHHQVYLLGAYPSQALGRWVYMVQDSGSGATDLYTWRELQDLVKDTQVLSPSGPVRMP